MRSQWESNAGLQFKANVQSYTRIRLDKQSWRAHARRAFQGLLIASVGIRRWRGRAVTVRASPIWEMTNWKVDAKMSRLRCVPSDSSPPCHVSPTWVTGVGRHSLSNFSFFFFAKRLPQNVEMLRDGDDDVRQAVKQDAFGSRWFWETEQNRNLQGRNEQRRQTGKTHTHTRTHTLKKNSSAVKLRLIVFTA